MSKVHPSAVIDKTAQLADNVVVGPNCVIEEGVRLGPGCILDANVVIAKDVIAGSNNIFYASCVIGRNPQILGLDMDGEFGKLKIGDGNIIREQVTIHPSMHSEKFTTIGNDNMIMIGVHIGHDCIVENKIVISNYSQISGHCKIETGVWLSGNVQLHQFVTLGKWCYATGFAGVNHDVPPFVIVSGHYPPEVRTINKRGLSRAGLDEQQQQAIFEAFKKIYRNGGPLLENAKELAQQPELDDNVRAMADTIINSSKHRFGRYRETFR
jgi:UDP-N-acetylglucosamine acyltransferase